MMKSLILISYFFIILTSTLSVFGQNTFNLKGKIIDYKTEQILPAVKIVTYSGKILLDSTDTDLENGSFDFYTKNTTDKIVISNSFYYPIIIENINDFNGKELDLGTIKLIENSLVCTRYISKKAEREDKKVSKRESKKGIEINSDGRNYKMRLKKSKGKSAFYIEFNDFQDK